MDCRKYKELNVHYCPIYLKDSVQLKNRLLRRAKNVAKPYDEITEEGLLIKGIFFPSPNINTAPLSTLKSKIQAEFEIPDEMISINQEKKCIETAWWILEEIAAELKKKGFKCYISEIYPTVDELETTRIPL